MKTLEAPTIRPQFAAAAAKLSSLMPSIGPWTRAALWHGVVEEPIPTTELTSELDEICRQRLAPLALSLIRDRGLAVSRDVRHQLQESSFGWSSLAHFVLRRSEAVLRALEDSDVAYCVSKGPGIASTYPNAMHRPFADLDLLVARKDFSKALGIICDLGYAERARSRQPWPYFNRWCREGINLKAQPGGSVDLHHHVPPWLWSQRLLTDDLVWRAEPTTFYGVQIPCLTPEDNLLVAALHIVSDRNCPGATLITWRDLVQLTRASSIPVAASRARAAGLSAWLAAVLQSLPAAVRPDELLEAVRSHHQSLKAPWRLAGVLSERSADWGPKASQLARLPILNGAAFAAGMLLPAKRFVQNEFPGSQAPYRHWWAGTLRSQREKHSNGDAA